MRTFENKYYQSLFHKFYTRWSNPFNHNYFALFSIKEDSFNVLYLWMTPVYVHISYSDLTSFV